MKRTIEFYKMSGAGNDFIVIDNRRDILKKNPAGTARMLCRRNFSIGADGLILLEKSSKACFRMAFYNSDGSRAAMCGNGARCLAKFAWLRKIAPKDMVFETDAGMIRAQILPGAVKVQMPGLRELRTGRPLEALGRKFTVYSVNTGVPHAVIFVKNIKDIDAEGLGRAIRRHRVFSPAGTNVNFVKKTGSNSISIRTYERGVEGETFSCGTGSVASAVISAAEGLVSSPVKVTTLSGIVFKVSFNQRKTSPAGVSISGVYLEGPADVSFRGTVEL